MCTIFEIFEKAVKKNGKRIFFKYKKNDHWIEDTYEDVWIKVLSGIIFFRNLKINENDHVSLLSENKPEWILTYLSLNALGATVIPIDINLSKSAIINIVSHCESKHLVVSELKYQEVSSLKTDLNLLEITILEEIYQKRDHKIEFNQLELPKSKMNNVASIIYTSGTMGDPKGVMITNANLWSISTELQNVMPVNSETITIVLLPLHHIIAFANNAIYPMRYGCQLVFSPSLKSSDILETLKVGNPHIFCAVPQLLDIFINGILNRINELSFIKKHLVKGLFKLSLSCERWRLPNPIKFFFAEIRRMFGKNLDYFVSGGAFLNPETTLSFRALGMQIRQGYGLTETTGCTTATQNFFFPLDSSGKTLSSNIEIDISNPDESGVGEIMIKGKNITKGFYKNEKATSEVIKNGWFYTGDLGMLNSRGHLTFKGRKSNMIVLASGKNVYPEELAEYYKSNCKLISDICVFGLQAKEGEQVVALIYPKEELLTSTKKELHIQLKNEIENLNQGLATYQVISAWKLNYTPLPRTSTKKIIIRDVKSLYDELPVVSEYTKSDELIHDSGALDNPVGERIKKVLLIVSSSCSMNDISKGDNISMDLGIDSLKRLNLGICLETEFRLTISNDKIFEFRTVNDIYRYIISQNHSIAIENSNLNKEGRCSQKEMDAILNQLQRPKTSIILFTIFIFISRTFWKTKFFGGENLKENRPYILCPNHESHFDLLWVTSYFPEKIRKNIYVFGKKEHFSNPITRYIAQSANVIPVNRQGNFLASLEMGKNLLSKNSILFLHPEGTRTSSGLINDFKEGAALLSFEKNVPMVPVCIKGAFEIFPNSRKLPKLFGHNGIKIIFGKPIYPDIDKNRDSEITALTKKLKKEVETLKKAFTIKSGA